MSQQELLGRTIGVLSAARIDYMIVGSHASSAQGEPRATFDVDFVVSLSAANVPVIVAAFPPPQYYADDGMIRAAIRDQGEFNIICNTTGYKADFWILKSTPYERSCFSRRRVEDLNGVMAFCSAPEDTILSKLRWADLCGGSEKQLRDALRVYEVQHPLLDRPYMDTWADSLGVRAALERIRKEAVPL